MRANTARTLRAAGLLILTAQAACDNVDFGRAEVRIVKPPPPEGVRPEAVALEEEGGPSLGLPRGSVLFHVARDSTGAARITPVAEVSGDSLRTLQRPAGVSPQAYEQRFRQAVLQPNTQFALFRRGAPVGTFTLSANAPLTPCGVPTGAGQIATVAAAAAENEFLAFRRGLEPQVRGEFPALQIDGLIRRYSAIVAERLVLQNGLPRPRSWTGAQRDVQALDAVRGGNQEMSATFLSGDNLGVGPAQPDGYSVFYIAGYETRTGYTPFYSEVRDYRRVPKGAPKVVDYLDWNGQGGSEILVQVFGASQSTYEVISQDRGGRWAKVWESRTCGGDAPAGEKGRG